MDKYDAEYWHNYYHDMSVVGSDSAQRNVGRLKDGTPISSEEWAETIHHIKSVIHLNEADTVAELCCGNGMIIGELADLCGEAVGIDYSAELLKQLEELFPRKVQTVLSNVLEAELEKDKYDVIIFYFAIQHFSDSDAVRMIEKTFNALKSGGRLFIGDIPNSLKLWQYVDKQEYRKDYIERLLENRPMIGNWFHPEFFSAIAAYLGNANIEIMQQPEFMINAHYRFDVLFTK